MSHVLVVISAVIFSAGILSCNNAQNTRRIINPGIDGPSTPPLKSDGTTNSDKTTDGTPKTDGTTKPDGTATLDGTPNTDGTPVSPPVTGSCQAEGVLASVDGQKAQSKNLKIVNNTSQTVKLYWLDTTGKRVSYGELSPGNTRFLTTAINYPWLIADSAGKCLMIAPNKDGDGDHVCVGQEDESCQRSVIALDPFYQKVIEDNGLWFIASAAISEDAITRARYIVNQMLTNKPDIREKMAKLNFRVEIIGRNQVLSDLPDYRDLKGKTTADGRTYDQGTRGVGDPDKCSVGEENLLCEPNDGYYQEDILVHEFAHSIKSNFDTATAQASESAFASAKQKRLYPSSIYMMQSSQEYWAEGTQSWMYKTARSDVNAGYNTPDKLRSHDPALAAILQDIYPNIVIDRAKPDCQH